MIAIAAGQAHSLALKNDGTVWAWGNNMYGQLGYIAHLTLQGMWHRADEVDHNTINAIDPNQTPFTVFSKLRAAAEKVNV